MALDKTGEADMGCEAHVRQVRTGRSHSKRESARRLFCSREIHSSANMACDPITATRPAPSLCQTAPAQSHNSDVIVIVRVSAQIQTLYKELV